MVIVQILKHFKDTVVIRNPAFHRERHISALYFLRSCFFLQYLVAPFSVILVRTGIKFKQAELSVLMVFSGTKLHIFYFIRNIEIANGIFFLMVWDILAVLHQRTYHMGNHIPRKPHKALFPEKEIRHILSRHDSPCSVTAFLQSVIKVNIPDGIPFHSRICLFCKHLIDTAIQFQRKYAGIGQQALHFLPVLMLPDILFCR